MEYCNANLYSNTPVLQNSILFNPVNPVKLYLELSYQQHFLCRLKITRIQGEKIYATGDGLPC